MKSLLLLVVILGSSAAMALENTQGEINVIIQCHEAMDGKTDGRTEKLSLTSPTPLALVQSGRIFFLTSDSIYSLKNTYHKKDLLIHLKDKGEDFYRKMEIRKDGTIGTMSFDEIKDGKEAIEPTVSLDEASLKLFKNDLLRRVKSITGEYQNKYDPQDTLNALERCKDIQVLDKENANLMTQTIAKQSEFYKKLLKKTNSYSNGLKKESDTGKAAGKK